MRTRGETATVISGLMRIYAARVSAGEEMMIERFERDYREYMLKTGRLLPLIYRRRKKLHAEV